MDTSPNRLRWSFSQWETYNGCPARWNYQSVLKLPRTPPGPAAARGLEMHDRADKYITGEIDDLSPPSRMFGSKRPVLITDKYKAVLDQFRNHENGDRWAEKQMAFDDDWSLSGRTAPNTRCIMVLDATRCSKSVLHVGEWKSGKPKQTHADQRKLYALGGLRRWMVDEVIVTTYYFEDTAPPDRLVVKHTAEQKLKDLWRGRVEQMENDQIRAPKPGNDCMWCDFAKTKGGPCQFS